MLFKRGKKECFKCGDKYPEVYECCPICYPSDFEMTPLNIWDNFCAPPSLLQVMMVADNTAKKFSKNRGELMIKYLYRVLTLACTKCGTRKKVQAGGFFCPKCQMRVITYEPERE